MYKAHLTDFVRKARNNICSFGKCSFTTSTSKYYSLKSYCKSYHQAWILGTDYIVYFILVWFNVPDS